MAITEVRIHPAIGIARVGNSDSDFFIGPERRWDRSAPQGGYKDAQCRIKRQAARFRVFGYDNGVPVELTAANASIQWTVHLINRKAVAPGFPSGSPRNSTYSGADRDGLIIDPGSRTLNGPDQRKQFDSGTFKVKNHAAKTVSLGEIRTDDDGRLLVLGGFGNSGSPSIHALVTFDSEEWHDDVSDGPVTATVTVGDQTFTAAGSWVIVAPPKFAPPIDNVFRLWDMLFDVFVKDAQLQVPATPSYVNDVYPILQGAADALAVNSDAIGHHGFSHPMAGSSSLVNRLTVTGSKHMPKLESEANNLTQDLKLTDTQIAIMQKWAAGTVNNDWNNAWVQGPPPDPTITPDGLDKAALENCVGGALYPGIEAGRFLRDATKFLPVVLLNGVPSFRLDHSKVSAGQVTQSMAVPWQSDFWACAQYWWPVPRPNQLKVAGQGTKDWTRLVANREEFVAGKWNAMGFVTRQGSDLVETDRCDTADTWVSLVTPALTFDDVPQGPMGTTRKTARAIVFEIRSTVPVTLSFTAPADASLTRYTASPYTQPPTGAAVATARLWIIYAPPNDSHSVTDSVTVTCNETGQTWTVPITANSVPRKTAAAALVLDKSGSMSEDRGDGQGIPKSQSVRDAAKTFVEVMLPGDALSLTAFDDNASVLTGLTTLGDPSDPFDTSRSTMNGFINGPGLNPGGATSIGDGIFEGRSTLSGATAQVQSLVVLTDGNENRTRWISDVADQINENTYSIGVGTASNTSAAALETISGNHGGYLLITGAALGGDNEFLLKKYFLQILAGVSNAEIVLDPVGIISSRQVQRIPFVICEQDNLADVILLAQDRKYLQFLLETPSGQLVDPNIARTIGGQFIATSQVSYYRIPLPLLVEPGRPSHVGTWNAVLAYGGRGSAGVATTHLEGGAAATGRQRYSVIVHTWSDVAFNATAHQSGFTPGATVNLIAGLSAAGIPFTANAHTWAEITRPGGAVSTVDLWPHGDEFLASFTTTVPGDYRIRVRATGQTDRGNPFTRERSLSVGVWRGGDTPPRGGPGDIGSVLDENRRRWCAFLRCVLSMLAQNDQLLKRWRELGIDPRELVKCVELLCQDEDATRMVARPASDEVRRLVDELHRSLSGQ